jgi:glycosyltransferase involved in cell wall biosynthesis
MGLRAWLLTYERMPDPTVGGPFVRLGWLTRTIAGSAEMYLFSRGDTPAPSELEPLWNARHTRLPGLGSRPLPRFAGILLLATPYLLWRCVRERPHVVVASNAVFAPFVALTTRLPRRWRPRVWADCSAIVSLEIERSGDPPRLLRRRQRIWRRLERAMLEHADVATAVNTRMAELLRERTGVEREIDVLRNAGAVAEPRPPDAAFLSSLGIEEKDTVCFFVGTLFSGRLLPLLRAFPRALERERSLKLVVAGVGPDLERYRSLAGPRVLLVGFRSGSELEWLLSRADLAFSDCWAEDMFPLKAFLYMGAGKAMLLEDKPQVREVIGDGEALFFTDEDDLIEALVSLAKDPSRRRQLGEAGRRLLARAHTWDVRSEQVREILAQVAGRETPDVRAATAS